MKTQLEQWLQEEIDFLDNNYKTPSEVGYLEALNNCLDFLQGAQVFFDWQQRQREKEETKSLLVDLEEIEKEFNEYRRLVKAEKYWEAAEIGKSLHYRADTARHIQNGTF